MSYCVNPHCQHPENSDGNVSCSSCGSNLLLKGRYRIVQALSSGISGRTFQAIDLDKPSQPLCAIKQYFPQDGNSDRDKFRLAALQLDRIGQHPQVPDLLAYFEEDGCQYLVQEFIEGRNLAQELSDTGIFNEIKIWQLLSELLPILQFTHEFQVIHRDLKPENIISRSTPASPKGTKHLLAIVDFSTGHLKTLKGSAEYAAPEQIQGKAVANSDLYSLGVTCLHLLTGVSPFDLFDIKAETWVWRHYLRVPVSDRLALILDKLVQRNPALRYQSAAAVLKDLKCGPVPLTIFHKPQWTLTAWGGAAIALLSLALNSKLPSPVPQPSFTAQQPISTIPDIRYQPPQIDDFSRQLSKEPTPMRTLALTSGPVWSVAVTPNGKVVATGSTDGSIRLLHIRNGKVLKTLAGHSGPIWSLAISPDGKTIASGSGDNTVRLWDLYTGKLTKILFGHKAGVFSVAFSPDGKVLASVGKDRTIKLWEVETGMELHSLQGHSDDIQSVAFSPDRVTLATGSNDGTVKLWNWQTGEAISTLQGHSDAVWSVAFSPDGQTLASGSWDNTVKLWDLSPNQWRHPQATPLRTFIGHVDKVQSLAFSPDGQTLASGDLSGTIKLWQMSSGGLMGTLKGHSSWVELAFSPRGKMLVSGSFDDTVKVWRLP